MGPDSAEGPGPNLDSSSIASAVVYNSSEGISPLICLCCPAAADCTASSVAAKHSVLCSEEKALIVANFLGLSINWVLF